jgi:HSP20 family protein
MMGTNGDKEVAVRRPAFADLDDLWNLVRFDNRWPFSFPTRAIRAAERELPAIDMYEKDGKVVVKAEMPGIDADKIDVRVVDGELRISGEREAEKEVKEEHFYRSERSYGRIYRAVALPEGCDVEHVEAKATNGVLKVEIPRKQAAEPKKIEVKSS